MQAYVSLASHLFARPAWEVLGALFTPVLRFRCALLSLALMPCEKPVQIPILVLCRQEESILLEAPSECMAELSHATMQAVVPTSFIQAALPPSSMGRRLSTILAPPLTSCCKRCSTGGARLGATCPLQGPSTLTLLAAPSTAWLASLDRRTKSHFPPAQILARRGTTVQKARPHPCHAQSERTFQVQVQRAVRAALVALPASRVRFWATAIRAAHLVFRARFQTLPVPPPACHVRHATATSGPLLHATR